MFTPISGLGLQVQGIDLGRMAEAAWDMPRKPRSAYGSFRSSANVDEWGRARDPGP